MSEDVSAISPSRAAFLAAAEAKAAQIAAAAAKISPEPSDPRPDTESLSSRDNVLRNNVTASDSDFVSSSENGDTSSKIASSAMSSMSSSDYSDSSDDDLPATNPCQPIETNVNIASVTISISPQLTPVMKSNLRATYSNSSASSTPITPTAVGPYSPSHRAPARVSSILKRRDSESVSRGSSAPPSPVPSGDRERSVSIDEKRYDESRLKRMASSAQYSSGGTPKVRARFADEAGAGPIAHVHHVLNSHHSVTHEDGAYWPKQKRPSSCCVTM